MARQSPETAVSDTSQDRYLRCIMSLIKIANALSVSVDELLCDSLIEVKPVYDQRIANELADCDAAELQAFLEIIQTTKTVIRKNRKVTNDL